MSPARNSRLTVGKVGNPVGRRKFPTIRNVCGEIAHIQTAIEIAVGIKADDVVAGLERRRTYLVSELKLAIAHADAQEKDRQEFEDAHKHKTPMYR